MLRAKLASLRALLREAPAFAVVGTSAYAVDVCVFNALHGAGADPFTAKAVSLVVSTAGAYLGNKLFVFRGRDSNGWRGVAVFFALNGVALLFSFGCMWVSRLLGFDGPVAMNVSGNLIGTGLGTLFRFVTYRRIVFVPADDTLLSSARVVVEPVPTRS